MPQQRTDRAPQGPEVFITLTVFPQGELCCQRPESGLLGVTKVEELDTATAGSWGKVSWHRESGAQVTMLENGKPGRRG